MKDPRNYIFAIAALVIAFLLFRGCQQEKKITELESSSNNEQLLRDINLLESKIKSKEQAISLNRKFQDSILTENKELVRREKNRVKIKDLKAPRYYYISDTGCRDCKYDSSNRLYSNLDDYWNDTLVSKPDYDTIRLIGIESQEDLSKALEKNLKLDSTIHIERALQASKDTSNNTIISRQQEAITEKEKEKEKLQNKLRVSKFFLKAGAVAIAVLSVVVAVGH